MTPRIPIGVALLLIGGVWVLQGIDVMGGYGMSGHIEWTLIGGVLIVIAIGLLAGARKPRDDD